MQGIIFDIKEFAVHDGPGMRQTVFLKGCPLRCNWCHNPEGLFIQPNLMVSANGCTHCDACVVVCPTPEDPCTACGLCVSACPQRLRRVSGERISPEALASRLLENAPYYSRYGGGVTFSGGEPLLQPDFLMETADRLTGVHLAIESCGHAQPDVFKRVMERMDYIMMDIKLMDSQLHRQHTGIDNDLILRNARTLCQMDIPFVIRIPLIPGVNDTEENYRQTAQLLTEAKALQRVELLPYHRTAGAKYQMTGQHYKPLFDVEQPVKIRQDIFCEYDIGSVVL